MRIGPLVANKKLAEYKEKKGILVLAKQFGCSPHTILKWINGERKQPRPEHMVRIAKATRGGISGNDWITKR